MLKSITKIVSIIASVSLFVGCQSPLNKSHLDQLSVIPQPVQAEKQGGYFVFNPNISISVDNDTIKPIAAMLSNLFSVSAGFDMKVSDEKDSEITFVTDASLKSEAYTLNVTPKNIEIKASDARGFFYAVQTIRQLLPANIEKNEKTNNQEWSISALKISDEPRFSYRGLMLDATRFFIPKETVLTILDCMGSLKINKLHFHLVDDNGWRIEIKKYPKLTEVGAWRVARDVPFSMRRNPQPEEPTPVGGFYTQEDLKEIVEYASKRMIEVIPEIEMPAHTNSSLAAYPNLACPTVKEFIGVLPGMGGDNAEIIYCAGNDSVFNFLEDVLDEVMEIFPSQYIHIGGDEAGKTNWRKCPKCQARMKNEKIHHIEELQSYFMTRVSKYIQTKGRRVIGWDELTNSTLPKDAIVLGWQGYGVAALKAARQGHQFIMTPARLLYFIRYQGPQWFEPLTYFGNNTLEDVYNYEPFQEDWEPEVCDMLMGVQASLWTEFCNSPEDVEYLLFPRLLALSEIAWSKTEAKNWGDFLERTDSYLKHLEAMNITFARSMFNLDHCITSVDGQLKVTMNSIRPDVEIRYTTDGTEPESSSKLYYDTLAVNHSEVISAATFLDGERKGETLTLNIEWNKATGKTVIANNPAKYTLTNGLRGSDRHTDFEWIGWYDKDTCFTIDFNKTEIIKQITLGAITNFGMGVHIPKRISIYTSDDNKKFSKISEITHTPEQIFRELVAKEDIVFKLPNAKARYLKFEFENSGICPTNHIREGKPTWVYFDEVIVN